MNKTGIISKIFVSLSLLLPCAISLADVRIPQSGKEVRTTRIYDSPPNLSALIYHDFCQDKTGYLWIATESGLIRFDGTNYEVFRNDKNWKGTISDNRLNRVFCDSRNDIWIATANGLNRFDRESEKFTVIKLPPSENIDGFIQDIAEQDDGTIVFNVAGNGLYLVDPVNGKNEATRIATLGPKFDGNSIFIARNRNIIMGTHSGNIHVLKKNGIIQEHPLSKNYILGLCAERGDDILIYGPKEIWRMNTETLETRAVDVSALGGTIITKICVGSDNVAYIASNHGLWRLVPDSDKVERCLDYFNSTIDITKAKIGSIYIAHDGNLWAGCNYQGIIMAPKTPLPFNYYPLHTDISDFRGGLTAMTSGRNGTWLAIEDGDIVNIQPGGKPIRRISLPSPGDVRAFLNDGDKAIYAVTSEGTIWRIDPETASLSKITSLGKYAVAFRMCKSEDSPELFISIVGYGLIRYNTATGEKTEYISGAPNADRLYSDWINSMFLDSKKRLWLGIYSGLACLDIQKGSFRQIRQDRFKKMAVNAVNETGDGKILLGTSDGLLVYNPETDTVEKEISNADGLADNDIRTIQVDNNGMAWIGTMLGLSRYNPKTGAIASTHGGYGLSETSFRYSSFNREKDEMCFAGNLGYTFFNPNSVKALDMAKNVYISGIYLNGEKLTMADMTEGKKALTRDSLSGFSKVRVSHNDNNLLLKVSTMDFRDPENVTYEWMMKGDKTWNVKQPGNSAIVIPTLSPGNHTILLRASDNGIYSPVTELSVHVTTPWYLTHLAKAVYLLIFAGVAYLLFYLFKKRSRERLNETKVKFFIDISHEIRSPITCIISPLETLLRKETDPERKMLLTGMKRNAGRILNLANQLLELRKIDKGKKTLKMRPTDMKGFAEDIIELYRNMAESKHIDVTLDVAEDMPQVWVDRDNFDKVLVNLISNALKFTPENGKVHVAVKTADDGVAGPCAEISVTDTGTGIDPRSLPHIFERFYQDRKSSSGFGVGLNLAWQIVRLHHGNIAVANRTDGVKGCVFTITLPLGDAHIKDEEKYVEEKSAQVETAKPSRTDIVSTVREEADIEARIAGRSASSRHMLIVDDDTDFRRYLCTHCSRYAKVYEAADGAEAMKILLSKKIDVVVSDVVMPVMGGLGLLRKIKANTETNHIPVILLSTRAAVEDRLAGWDRGADAYIGKPFDVAELDALVLNMIDNRLRIKGKFSGSQDSVEKIQSPEIKGNDEILLERVMAAIESHFDDSKFNVEKLGEEIGISRAHLHRKMKELVGMTPSDYIRNVKLKHACTLLRRTDIDITQVAYGLGFNSQPHFSTAFKNFTGMTPSEYRASLVKEEES